ncbi:Interferon-induced GTP-binding protein Mx2 [Escovopsis weberi]|uniref:Interferon-induced GTP-binding protein Mx2 n=1 Tax=Escovopsis weberi TaxID=150374 RepID=A0A0M9VWL3_ESCWE|nr:Interferon-induced GTP-binding protein Mx2 [Escovopsis weberi]
MAAAGVAASSGNGHDSFFHTSFYDIGKKLKACNDTLGELQQLGVSHDVQLPELVLVGDQSAGKSSLMSGLANLELPRSEGTCTRCPLHIRVSRNSDWSCRVWLRKEYTYRPPNRPISEKDVTEQDPFFPWRKMGSTKVHEFKTMQEKSEIEEVLRWAQIAILNDDKPHSLFVPGSGAIAMNKDIDKAAEETFAKFSPNVVALEIKGPALPDLSFYDMPGVFTNPADAKDQYLVNVVQNLSRTYIKHPLPNIKLNVKSHLDRIVRSLAALPELPHNVELEIQTCLNHFADSSRTRIDEFAARINDVPANFRDCLLEIKPKFVLRDKSDIEVLEVSDDESDVGSMANFGQATPTSKRRSMMMHGTPSKRMRSDLTSHHVAPSPNTIKPEDTGGGSDVASQPLASQPHQTLLAEPFSEFSKIGRGFRTLRQVQDEIQAKMKAGMPNIIPPEVYNDLAMESIRPWNGPTDAFLAHIVERLQGELESALDNSLQSLKKRFIYTEAKRHLKACLKEHHAVTRKALEELYGDETERLMTFNEGALKQCIREEEDVLFRFRHQMRMQGAGFAVKPLPPWESLTEEKQAQDVKRRQVEEARLKPDQFIREVKVVAYVRGYYRLAALRYADAASQRIICRMIPAIRRQLRNYLDTKLGVQGPDAMSVYERLMAEDAATAQRRDTLKSEKQKFELALASIETLEQGASAASEPQVDGSFSVVPMAAGRNPRRGSDVTMVNDDAECEA